MPITALDRSPLCLIIGAVRVCLLLTPSVCGQPGTITTLAGAYPLGDGGPARLASIYAPAALSFDRDGSLLVSQNDHRVRRISPAGITSTVGGDSRAVPVRDGRLAPLAGINSPRGTAVDAEGNLYIAVWAGVRRIDSSGIISTWAGNNHAAGMNGDGGPAVRALLNDVQQIAVDPAGNLLVADTGNHRIRKITRDGIISTFAGARIAGFSGDGGPAERALLNRPCGITLDAS